MTFPRVAPAGLPRPAAVARTAPLVTAVFVLALAGILAAILALPSVAGAETTTLAVFGDINDSSVGDTPAAVFGNVCTAIAGSGATAAITPGDALNDIADTSVTTCLTRWDKYLAVENPKLGASMPIWRVGGDNDRLDLTARLTAWNQVFPGLPVTPDPSRRWYSKDFGSVHVIFLASAYAGSMGYIGYVSETSSSNSTQANWLVSDLVAATSGDGPSTIVVVSHYPPVNGKTTKPYASTQKPEAEALKALFAKYGVDMVVCGDTHVYRRSTVAVNRSGATFGVPYVQIPPAASPPRSFGVSPVLALAADEAGWAPGSSYRGFMTLSHTSETRVLDLSVFKVAVSGGASSSAEDRRANANPLGGSFTDVPEGCAVGVASSPDTVSPVTVADAPNGWVATTPLHVSLLATDDASGVATTHYREEGTAAWSAYTQPIEVASEGETTFEYRSTDLAGNTEPVKTVTVRIETNAPVTTDNADSAMHRSFTLVLTATDDASGVSATEYRIDGGLWTSGESVTLRASVRHKRAGLARGDHLVEYRSIDAAGNVEETKSCVVRIG